MIIKNIPKSSADLYKSLLAEFKPNWNVEIIIEDYNLYKLGFVEEIPCSISLNVSREEIYELQEEILDMEVTIYSYEDMRKVLWHYLWAWCVVRDFVMAL